LDVLNFDLNQTIRTLVEDSDGNYATDNYLAPLVNLQYINMYNQIRLYGPDVDEFTVELPAVAAGTPDLSSYSAQNKPLYNLLQPREIEWKLPGLDATHYYDAEGPLNKVRDIAPPGIQALDCWSYNAFNIQLSLFSTALDLRIRGEFLFSPLTGGANKSQLGANILPALAFRVAKVIAQKRGNQQWITNYGAEAAAAEDAYSQGLVHARQGKIERVGSAVKRNPRDGYGW
jgi:hypothetical protein